MNNETSFYFCSECKKFNVKLWRCYNETVILRCAECTCKHEKTKKITQQDLNITNTIKFSIPAIHQSRAE